MARIIYNSIIPFKGNKAITILPFIFARNGAKPLGSDTVNHESIHLRQQVEMLVVSAAVIVILCLTADVSWWWMAAAPFCYFVMYITEYAIRFVAYGRAKDAYRNISTEQEAFANEKDFGYLKGRMPFAWVKYLTKKTYKR